MTYEIGGGSEMKDDNERKQIAEEVDENELLSRRDFLHSLKKWSQIVIGGVALGALIPSSETEAGWVNSRGSWINGGGGGWANRGATWINGGGGWINRGGTWANRGGGSSWVNRRGW
jgi:hypothetical protein